MVYQGPVVDPTLPPAVAGPAFLADGTEVWVRPVQSSDGELLRDFVDQEPPGSPGLRHLAAIRQVLAREPIDAPSAPQVRLSLLVLGDRADRVAVLGIGEYARTGADPTVADVAFFVAGPLHGRGIATLLLARLARAARAYGVLRFEARAPAEDPEMLEVFRGRGLPLSEEGSQGDIDVLIPLNPEAGTTGAMAPGGALGPRATAGRLRLSALRSRA